MSVVNIYLSLEMSYHHSSWIVFYIILLFYSLIEVWFHYIYVFSTIVFSCFSFFSQYNIDQWYQSSLLLGFYQCMSPTRSRYRELDLKIVSLRDDLSVLPKQPLMVEEKR
jgi:hypothetical protein